MREALTRNMFGNIETRPVAVELSNQGSPGGKERKKAGGEGALCSTNTGYQLSMMKIIYSAPIYDGGLKPFVLQGGDGRNM